MADPIDMDAFEAQEIIDLIYSIQDDAPRAIVDAYRHRVRIALGYKSWEAMCEALRLDGLTS